MTIVGTPSSAAATPSGSESAGAGTLSVRPVPPAAARDSSSELRLNSC